MPEQKAYIVLGCDDLTERMVDQQEVEHKIGDAIVEGRSIERLAQDLVTKAIASDSSDNISVAVMEVGSIPGSVSVFDGHGGSEVSFAIGKDFYPTLKANIQLLLTQKLEAPAAISDIKQSKI